MLTGFECKYVKRAFSTFLNLCNYVYIFDTNLVFIKQIA